MFSSPCVARSPVSGRSEPTLTSPDRADASSPMGIVSSPGIIVASSPCMGASSSIEFTAAVTPIAMAIATPMPIIASLPPFNGRRRRSLV